MFRNTLTALLVLSTASAAFGADEKIEIKVKYAPGTYVSTLKMDVNRTTSMSSGRSVTHDISMMFVMEATIDKPGPKDQKVRITYKRIKQSVDSGLIAVSFDSEDPQDMASPIAGFYMAMLDKTLHVTLDSEGKVTEVTGIEEIWSEIAKRNPRLVPPVGNMKRQFGDQIKQMFGQIEKVLPKKPVAKGDTWVLDTKQQALPGLGEMSLERN